MSNIIEERDYMERYIIYIKFIGDCDNFDEWKYKTKSITRHKGIIEYLTKEW